MRNLIIAALVALPALTGAASADEARMSQTEFVRAARCLAYVSLPALQSDRPDMSALSSRFSAEKASKREAALDKAKDEVHLAHVDGARANTPAEVTRLQATRDRVCSAFTDRPVVANN